MKSLAILILFTALARGACLEVSSERITAGDLAVATSWLQALDPGTLVGFAPMPGTRRVLSIRELNLLARKYGLQAADARVQADVCVERAIHPLSPEELVTALTKALKIPDAELELIDFSRQPLPPGQLLFELARLGRPADSTPLAPVIWRGNLIYDGRRSAGVWAKVRITVQRSWLVATENIPAGAEIRAGQIRTASGREFPFGERSLQSPSEIAGKVARRRIDAGARFVASLVGEPPAVSVGDRVQVQVIDGATSLSLDALAQTSGRKGDNILLYNLSSGRSFRAVIEEKGRAVVRPGPEL